MTGAAAAVTPAEQAEDDRVRRLLADSLRVWGVDGRVEVETAGAGRVLRVTGADGTVVTVARVAFPDGSRQWQVRRIGPDDGEPARPRTHGSAAGMLRGVRLALDPAGGAGRLSVTPAPAVGAR